MQNDIVSPEGAMPAFLTPEWIAEVRKRCADYKNNPRAKRWGRATTMLWSDVDNIPKLLDEVERLRADNARLRRRPKPTKAGSGSLTVTDARAYSTRTHDL